jgi:hypothetical protein
MTIMMNKRNLIFLSFKLFLTISVIFGQTNNKDIDFLELLIKQNEYTSVIKYIDVELKLKKTDSIQFLKAWSFYNIDQQDSAKKNFEKISSNNIALFNKSKFFSSASSYLSKDFKSSETVLKSIKIAQLDTQEMELLALQKAGISLLRRDFNTFNEQKQGFKFNNYNFSEEESRLEATYLKLKSHKKKNPIKAAVLSAILPGSGKWYAGNKGQAITSFFSFALPAAIATEAYFKSGSKSVLFIASSIVTSIFYGGSIIGSAYATKRVETNFNNGINEKILFNIHFPLRRFYSR